MAAPKGEKLLAEAIRSGRFAPVYCLYGDNDFRKDEAVRQIVSSATEESTRDFNVDMLRAPDADAQAIEVSLSTLPMMAARRVVVIRDPGALKKQARSALERYLEAPAAETVLILVIPAGSEVPKAIAQRLNPVQLENLSGQRLSRWIEKQARSATGAGIDADAAQLLQQVVGQNLMELAGEIDKLGSYAEGRPIDATAVAAVVGVRPGETLLDLTDAVVARDVRRALGLIAPVLRQPKVTGVLVVMSLTVQLLGIGWCRARRNGGAPARKVEQDAFTMARRVPYFLSQRSPGESAGAWVRAASNWTAAEVEAALDTLLATDMALKQTGVASEEQLITNAVLAMCAGAERASAAA